VMKKKGAGRKADDAEDTIESLGEHALNFAADEAGSGEIEIGKREHVALDAALLFLVNGHDEEHANKGDRDGGDGEDGVSDQLLRGLQQEESQENDAPEGEGQAEEAIRERFVVPTLVPENEAHGDIDEG